MTMASQPAEAVGTVVVLREIRRSDVELMAYWPRFDEAELQWANLDLTTAEQRDAWYERNRSIGHRRRFTIWDHHGRVIGTVGLRNIDFRYGEGTLGIIVNAADVGKGYGTDAVNTIVEFAFEQLGLRKVYLDVAEDNVRAQRSYEKVGFVRIGQHRGTEGLTYVDMSLSRERFQSRAARF
ncbi:MAG: GNAT family N-acetyltransferase [Chloroflexi bacterium]|nr:GNAT family N-acetyltransferase [Chloroflexota bacterium]